MKKLLLLLPVILFACCTVIPNEKPRADLGYFTVEKIEVLEEDSAKDLGLDLKVK